MFRRLISASILILAVFGSSAGHAAFLVRAGSFVGAGQPCTGTCSRELYHSESDWWGVNSNNRWEVFRPPTAGDATTLSVAVSSKAGAARAYANLAARKVGVKWTTALNGNAGANAGFEDDIVFKVAGATPTTVTRLKALVSLTAPFGPFSYAPSRIDSEFSLSAGFGSGGYYGSGGFDWIGNIDAGQNSRHPQNRSLATWLAGDTRFFEFEFDIVGNTVPQRLGLGLNGRSYPALGQPSRAFDVVANLRLILPRGVTAISPARSSNVFAVGVPEPASWAMMIAGFGLTGAAMRRRRNALPHL